MEGYKTMTKKETEKRDAIEYLKKSINKGDTLFTIVTHVSKSGMSRNIKVLDLFDYLSIQLNNNPKIDLYYQEDSHYSLNGQKIVSDIISEYLKTIN